MKRIIVILCFLCLMLLTTFCRPLTVFAVNSTVTSFEQLEAAIINATESTKIIVSNDIAIEKSIIIPNEINITIKSKDNQQYVLTVTGNFDPFIIKENSSLILENITLSRAYYEKIIIKGPLTLGSGDTLFQCEDISNGNINSDNTETSQKTSEDTANSIMDIASLVVSWSGFALAFLTILASILGILGFRELKDLQTTRNEVNKLQVQLEGHVNQIQQLEETSKNKLSQLAVRFEEGAYSILQATHYYTCGSNSYRDAEYRDAISYFQKSLKYLPNNTDSICLMGRAYNFLGKRNQSYDCYMTALKIDSTCASAHRGLAAWYRFSDISEALKHAKLASKYAPEDYEILNYLGQIYRDNGMTNEALEAHIDSSKVRPHPDTDFFLSIIYAAEFSLGRAKVHINKAIDQYDNEEEFSKSKPVWKTLAHWVRAIISGDDDEALHLLHTVAEQLDSEKTRKVAWGHIDFLLHNLKKNQEYILKCKKIMW